MAAQRLNPRVDEQHAAEGGVQIGRTVLALRRLLLFWRRKRRLRATMQARNRGATMEALRSG
jgi:hypothetical protein